MAISLGSGGGGSKPSTQGCQIERPSTKPASGKNGNNSVLGKPGTFGTFNVAGTSTYKGITICPYGGQKKSGGTSSSKYPTYDMYQGATKKQYFDKNPPSQNFLKNLDDLLSALSKGSAYISVGSGIIAQCLMSSGVSLTPQGAIATGFFIGLAYVSGGIGIGTGLTEAYTGYNEKTLDGRTLSKEEAEYRKNNGLESAITSALAMANAKLTSEINKQMQSSNASNSNNQNTEGTSGTKVSADDIKFTDKFNDPKYTTQVTDRLWNNQKIADAINNPYKIVDSVNTFTGNPAKVYFINDTHYVVVDSVTNKIVQISDLRISDWIFTPGNFTK